jgi:hypothetical protein
MKNTESQVKFLQNGVRSLVTGKLHPCWYSHTTLIDGRVCVTLYAKSILTGLPRELQPINNSDCQTDYFESDHVRFFEGSPEYAQLVQLIAKINSAREARVARRMSKISHSAIDCFNPEGRPQRVVTTLDRIQQECAAEGLPLGDRQIAELAEYCN